MSPEELTSRRTIVKTGAKLAYAAPVVAASFKLQARGAGAQYVSDIEGGSCSGDFTCGQDPKPCGVNDWGTCYCFATAEGGGFCGSNESCGNLEDCTTSKDCPSNHYCSVNTCCGKPVCIEVCPQSRTEPDGGSRVQGGQTPSGR